MEIPFFKQCVTNREKELINNVIDGSLYDIIDVLEMKLREFFGVKHVITTNNGTAAKHLALSALDLKRGDKIICSVNSFPDVAQVIRYFDAEPIFVDINTDDFNIDPNRLRDTLKIQKHKKLKYAFISHIAGQSADMEAIYSVANEFEIQIIDDANTGIGITYKNNKLSQLDSLISCFQLNQQIQNNIANTGIITTNNDEIAKRAKILRNCAITGINKDGTLNYVYDVIDIGLQYNLCMIDAAYSLAQLEKLDKLIQKRQEIAMVYDNAFKDCPHIDIPIKKRDHIYSQYIIKVDKNRDNFAQNLLSKGINTSLQYIPLHLLSYYKNKYSLKINDFPNALKTYSQILSLPIYPTLSDKEVDYICKNVVELAKNRV